MGREKMNILPEQSSREPDAIVEVHRGDKVLVVKGYFSEDTEATFTDRMKDVIKAEAEKEEILENSDHNSN